MIFKDKKEDALGGNFKVKDLKVFGSKENLYKNFKKYRKVYDEQECGYLYCEFSFYNKLFDELDWTANSKFICTDEKGHKVCELTKEIKIVKEKNIFYVTEGWGTPDPGWWSKGKYRWEVFINNKSIAKTDFYIVNGGIVTEVQNPYFEILEIKLFESSKIGLTKNKRFYLNTFNKDITRYINIEMKLANRHSKEKIFPLELQFNFYNDAGQHKGFMTYFKEIKKGNEIILLDTGYGSDTGSFWFEDNYTLEVIYMDQLIAVIPFKVGENEEAQEGSILFQTGIGIQTSSDINSITPKLSFEEAKLELENLIGLHSVKNQINELSSYLQFLKIRKNKGIDGDQVVNLHTIFTGNPGTGKTTVANMLGQIYHSLDLLSHGKVLEVGRADLVGEFIGQTAPKVQKVLNKAKGGILFIDEAYSLTDRGNDTKDFGREVLEVLLKELSDGSGDIAIIFAGYPKQMQTFLNSNPGLKSRLRNVIHFPDYSPEELMDIAHYTANKKGVIISEEAKTLIQKRLVDIYRNRNEQFGNARFINAVIDEAKQNMALRLMDNKKALNKMDKKAISTLSLSDVESIFHETDNQIIQLPIDEALLKDAMDQLKELVGLENIKREMDEIAKLVRYYKEIGKNISKSFSLHTVFKGNPGTGKTTIARLIVQIYKALGILQRGHLVECDRKSLVAGYTGQTAIKTGELIDKAMGGGLFIDEAYSLTSGGSNDFGKEAIETLLKRMEDQRGEFMVIVAGYPKEMKQFLEANPGLMSRFDRQFDFKDYTLDELFAIALLLFEKEEFELEEKVKEELRTYIQKLLDNKHKYFGNARTIRKIVSETIRRQNLRMADIPTKKRHHDLIHKITLEDVSNFSLLEADLDKKKGIGF